MKTVELNVQISADIEIPAVPKELKVNGGQIFPISTLSENALKKVGKAWTDELLKAAGKEVENGRPGTGDTTGHDEGIGL